MVSLLSSLGEVPAEIAFCFATGNTARMRKLDCGLIEIGRAADFVFMDGDTFDQIPVPAGTIGRATRISP